MKKNLLVWGTALVLVLVAFLVTNNYGKNNTVTTDPSSQSEAAQNVNQSSAGNLEASTESDLEKAIDFTLKDLNGNKVSLSDFKGKNVYLNFFTTWCPPCRAEMPDIEKVYQKYKEKDLVILAVDLGEDKDTVKSFIEQNNFSFKVLLDSDQSIAEKYKISAIPVSIFIDKEGNVRAKKVGAMTSDEMELYVKMLVDKSLFE